MPMISSLSSRERRRSRIFLLAAAMAAMPVLGDAHADDAVRQVLPGGQPTVAPQQLTREKSPDQSEIERFCSNIADAARDRRYALQAEELKQLQAGIDERMKALDAKKAEYETWLKRREVFLARAED
ncbi:MotE family protein, partial [Mesorhizobium sp. M8A.F.Ca.ET.021.01.1.1]|uniref:MotE family protein n=1 Tax=Mesorhizobium sp. M8A.F.Ca.ET.021.01.1.1 TaxID=2496757 RepID=UPI001673B371